MEMKRKINIAVCALFLCLLFGLGAAFWILPDRDFSEEENRVLQTLPSVSLSGWLDGRVTADFTTYCSDQFPLRQAMVSLRSLYDLALCRGESDGVLIGSGGQQAVRLFDAWLSRTQRAEDTDYFSESHIQAGVEALSNLKETLGEQGVPLYVLLAPRTVDVALSAFDYPADQSDRLIDALREGLSAAGVTSVDMTEDFRARYAAGEYVYYRTDHHWTTGGAYLAYAAILEAMGKGSQCIPAQAFTVRQVTGFFGTTCSRSGVYFTEGDTLEIWEADSDDCYVVADGDGEELFRGFINQSYLTGKDKYGAFLDGTHSILTVTQVAPDSLSPAKDADSTHRPRLLVARDSFASAVIPFLARHFDIVAVNLTGGMTNLSELAAAYECDAVLVLCNLENVVTSDCIRDIT
jgi:hypothetical protein